MTELKPAARIGKTQWRKWNEDQKWAFNAAIRAGMDFQTAVRTATAHVATEVAEEPVETEPKPAKTRARKPKEA